MDPAGAITAWHRAKTADGFTPAAFAALAQPTAAAQHAAAAFSPGTGLRVTPAQPPRVPPPAAKVLDAEEAAGPRSVLLGPAGSHDTSHTARSEELEAAAQAAAAAAAASPALESCSSAADAGGAGATAAATPAAEGSCGVMGHAAEDRGAVDKIGSSAGSGSSLASGNPASHGSTASLSCPPTPEACSSRRASIDGNGTRASTTRRLQGASTACHASPRRLAKLLGACVLSLRK